MGAIASQILDRKDQLTALMSKKGKKSKIV
jgi:hypothetical protein